MPGNDRIFEALLVLFVIYIYIQRHVEDIQQAFVHLLLAVSVIAAVTLAVAYGIRAYYRKTEIVKQKGKSSRKARKCKTEYIRKTVEAETEEIVPAKLIQTKSYKPSKKIEVDEDVGFFKHRDITLDEVKYLVAKGYKDVKQYSIVSRKRERYLLKPRYNESVVHFYLCREIHKLISQYTDKVWLYESVKPDVVFEIDKKRYAIEVETGSLLRNNRKALLSKVESLKTAYGKDWLFVVSDKNLMPDYSKLGQCYTKLSIARKLHRICSTSRMTNSQRRRTDKESGGYGLSDKHKK